MANEAFEAAVSDSGIDWEVYDNDGNGYVSADSQVPLLVVR
jgi:hypothetical protein